MRRITITIVTLFTILTFGLAAQGAATEHCPDHNGNPGKVEGGDLNDIVLDEGTVFCVKGSTDATGKLTADGETTLVAYLGNGHDVSYYVVYEEAPPSTTTTTTSIPETTTTTVTPTTTTQPEETTTTIEDETSSTSLPDNTTTTSPPGPDEPEQPGPESTTPDELPYTGGSDLLAYTILATLLLAMGGLTLSAMRGKNDES